MTARTHGPSSSARAPALMRELMGIVMQRTAPEMLTLMTESGLSMPQLVSLFALSHVGQHSVSELAERLNLSLAATSQLVDRLVTLGYVGRQESTTDRRQKIVNITTQGRALVERFSELRGREVQRALSELPTEISQQFERALALLVEHLRAQRTSRASKVKASRP